MRNEDSARLPSDLDRLIADARDQAERIELPQGPRPDAIRGYELIREIHRGGQGVVYLAYQRATHRNVAIKILREGPFAGLGERARFEREVQILAALQHPNIVAIHDSGDALGNFYFVMDYIAGSTLDEWADHRRATEGTAAAGSGTGTGKSSRDGQRTRQAPLLAVFVKICDALNVAHQRGVIHRDLKPTNIRVAENDEPFVLDFGLAKLTSSEATAADQRGLTATGQFLGTLPWASPEQVGGKTYHADTRTDIYALGLMLYRALTGRMPYGLDSSVAEIIRVITQAEPVRPRSLVRDLDQDLETIILKCLQKDPDRRYQTAAAVAEDLQRYLRYEPIGAKPESGWYSLRMFARRHRVAVGVTAGLIALLACASVLLAYLYVRARSSERLALRRADETRRVAEFQAAQLAGIDTALMGARIREALLEHAPARESTTADNTDVLSSNPFEQTLNSINFTDLALRTLDENVFQSALRTIELQFEEQPRIRAALLQTVADTLRDLGLLDRALEPQTKAYELRREILGGDHPESLASLHKRGQLRARRGESKQALADFQEALRLRRRVLGEEHPETLATEHELGSVLLATQQLDEAERHIRRVYEIRRRELGDQDAETLSSLSALGTLYFERGQFDEALANYQRALESSRRALGNDSPQLVPLINNVAFALRSQGKWDEAIELFREALAARRAALGDRHPDTLKSIDGLAGLLAERGQVEQSLKLRQEALAGSLATLGESHSQTLRSISGMGHVLMQMGRHQEAAPYVERSLQLHRRILGNDHSETIFAIGRQARLLAATGKVAEAISLFREARDTSRRVFGDAHTHAISASVELGSALNALGEPASAEPYLREAVAASQMHLGARHFTTLDAMSNLGHVLLEQKRYDEALTLYQTARDGYRETLGGAHPTTLSTILSIGIVRQSQGQWDQAQILIREALDGYRRALGDKHPFALRAINRLGELAMAQDQLDEAHSQFHDAFETSREALGDEHLETLRARISLGTVLTRMKRFEEAEQLLLEAAQRAEKLPLQHKLRLRVIAQLVSLYETWDNGGTDGPHVAQAAKWRELQAPTPPGGR